MRVYTNVLKFTTPIIFYIVLCIGINKSIIIPKYNNGKQLIWYNIDYNRLYFIDLNYLISILINHKYNKTLVVYFFIIIYCKHTCIINQGL